MADNHAPRYRRASFCAAGDCVEVASLPASGDVLIRDSKRPDVDPHRFTTLEWDAFIAGVKAGEFDREVL